MIQTWTRALNNIRHGAGARICASEMCGSARWQLWARRNTGCYLNGEWYCSDDCLSFALARLLVDLPPQVHSRPSSHTLPLGLLMLARGVIDESQLKQALETQSRYPNLRIGQCFCRIGAVSEPELTRALGAQHALPVLSTRTQTDDSLPLAIMETCRCVAFRGMYQSQLVYLGFDVIVNHSLITAAENVLDCQCEPCIVSSSLVEAELESRRGQKSSSEIVFESRSSESEMLRIIHSYAQQIRADQVRLSATDPFLWVKLSGVRALHLLFRS